MSVKFCLRAKIKVGRVDENAGRQILAWIEATEAEYRTRMTAAEAARAAAIDVADAAKKDVARREDLLLRSIEAQLNVLNTVASYRTAIEGLRATPGDFGFGNKAPLRLAGENVSPLGAAVLSLLTRDPHEIATGVNVHYLARDIRGRAHARFAEAIETLRPKALGLKAETLRETEALRALFGETDVSPEARRAAEAFAGVAEDLRQQFNAAGGNIPLRKNWRLPQHHDADKVAATTRESWIAYIRPLLDRADMLDFASGKPLSDAKLDALLDQVYGAIVSRGASGPPTMGVTGRPMLANSRAEARVLSFKDAASWSAYREAYGVADGVYETMIRHIADMADDIAQLRVLGPNPNGLKHYIDSLFDREIAALAGKATPDDPQAAAAAVKDIRKAASRLKAEKKATTHLWEEVTGQARAPVNIEWARHMGDMRGWLVGTQMGSAIISSLTDVPLMAQIARFNGLPVMNVIRNATTMMAEPGAEIRAAHAGLIADSLAQTARENDRFMGETIRSGAVAKMAGAVIRASGLRRWTATLRNAFGMEFMAHAARLAERPLGEIEPRFREAMARHGIGAAEWDLIRAAEQWEPRAGATFIRPLDVARLGTPEARAASERYAQLINTEMDYAVIESDPATRAMLYGGAPAGTVKGEVARAVGMYKAFPITFVTLHFARAFARGWDGSRLGHAAATLTAMWGFGILAMQAKQIAQGRDAYSLDPTDSNGLRAWGAGLLQSGGLGIFGDMLSQDKTRYGNSWVTTLAGPQFAAVESVLGTWLSANIGRSIKGEETHFFGDALYTAARLMPGSSLWYGRLAFQRAVVDQLARMSDDRAADRFARMEREAAKSWGQKFWWRPGVSTPDRAPAILGEP
ncbi:hypothetical protein [Chelatococcus asaccharovorans]|uniref:Uncharacterized protein n=1 Tax=Chelatococcus asaccharovorans TaxID=28210 RepID=A0A2V3UN12_9HYPH|nr:hypothetical protein [Chelatococcus asaccharovorans]MBS7703171.1 hypothetical protein [Chelatococcus asaccharovorans]PXW61500.1 hypothetical protein C7450_10315 [Chelatococcus asaccharovorans]